MFKKRNIPKTAKIALSVILLSAFILGFAAKDIFAQNQDCPSCPKKDEQKQEPNQPQPKEYMVGDLKVIEIPSKYSREELEKMFPVPEQWKEWYKLDKEGKLPKYVKIIDLYQLDIKNCQLKNNALGEDKPCKIDMNAIPDRFLADKYKSDHLDLEWYKNIVARRGEAGCRVLADIVSNENHTYYRLFPLLIKCMEEKPEYSSSIEEAILNIIDHHNKLPIFWKSEIAEMKKYIPFFWDLINSTEKNEERIGNKDSIEFLAINILYKLDENLESIISYCEPRLNTIVPADYLNNYFDPLNMKIINYVDIRLMSFYDEVLIKGTVGAQYSAFIYFIRLGLYDEYINRIVEYCKNNLNFYGISLFKEINILRKEDKRIYNLAEYIYENRNKINFEGISERSILNYLKVEFNIPNK